MSMHVQKVPEGYDHPDTERWLDEPGTAKTPARKDAVWGLRIPFPVGVTKSMLIGRLSRLTVQADESHPGSSVVRTTDFDLYRELTKQFG